MTPCIMTHTQGPWERSIYEPHVIYAPAPPKQGGKVVILRAVPAGDEIDGECIANAALAASAPEMLKFMKQYFGGMGNTEAEALIAKAEGRTPLMSPQPDDSIT